MALDTGFDIPTLEKDWLTAEANADKLLEEAKKIDATLEKLTGVVMRNKKQEMKVLLNQSDEIHAKHAAADRAAREAFDKLWSAKHG